MKKKVMSLLMTLVLVVNTCGCVLNSKVISFGDEFMGYCLNMKFSKMKNVAEDYEVFDKYADDELLAAILGRGEYKADKKSLNESDKKASVTYEITLPDYEEVIDDGDYEDLDEFIDNLDDAGKTSIKIKVDFKKKNDKWLVINCEDIAEDLFDEILDNDFGLGALSGLRAISKSELEDYASSIGADYWDTDYSNIDSASGDFYLGCEDSMVVNISDSTSISFLKFDTAKHAMDCFNFFYSEDSYYFSSSGDAYLNVSGNNAVFMCDIYEFSYDVFSITYCIGDTLIMTSAYDDKPDKIIEFWQHFGYPTSHS